MKKLPLILFVGLLVNFVIMIHEASHAVVASYYGIPIRAIAIGIPLPPYLKFQVWGKPMTVSPWLIGGAVEVNNQKLDELPIPEEMQVFAAGPLINLVIGFILIIPMIGLPKAISVLLQALKISLLLLIGKSWANLSGPIGIFKLSLKEIEKDGIGSLALILAVTNLGIGLYNLLPIYPLDGGKIAEILIRHAVANNPLSNAYLNVVKLLGLAVLALMFVRMIYNDISRRG